MLTALFDSLLEGVVVYDPAGRVVAANASAPEILGLSLAEITGETAMDPDWRAVSADGGPFPGKQHPAMVCLETGAPVRDVIMGVTSRARRERRWLRIHACPLRVEHRLVGAFACFEDITDRRRIEAQLSEAHEKLELALVGASLGTYDAHLPSGRVEVNDRYLDLLGYAPRELEMSVTAWMGRVNLEDLPRIQSHYDRIVTGDLRHVDIEYRLRHRDGSWVWLHDRGRVFSTDAQGQPIRIAGTLLDITARKQAELALQESEARYRTVVESAPDAILIFFEQRVIMANPASVRLFRASSEQELLGRDVWSLTSTRSHPLLRGRITRALKLGAVNPIAEVEINRCDGTPLPVDGVSAAIEYQGRRAVHVMMRDAMPRKQAEALVRQHREEMERTLALQVAHQTVAGIAHELNQPLNAITTLAEAARQQLHGGNPLPVPLASALEGIAHGAQRAGCVVHELMGFLRRAERTPEAFDLAALLQEVVVQCQAGRPFAGEIEVRLPGDIPQVAGNALQIEKIVLNLLRNAVEACQSVHTPGRLCRIVIEVFEAARSICLQVDDNGPGVPAELVPRLFQPFVSSKPGGLGMGLAISHSLAQSLGGTLAYEVPPGGGARFRLMLPAIEDLAG
ncbi:MAG: PAS domain S-box protein [Accumulibacter sp.]|jgi:two-component system sensor kinase FixL